MTSRIAGGALAVLALVGVAAGTRVPYHAGSDDAVIRLSWRVRGVRVEECRTLSAAELEKLPLHMRREQVCEGRLAPYRLRVAIDGVVLEDAAVLASGARADRPLYVFREFPAATGAHAVSVDFRLDGVVPSGVAAPALVWRGRVTLTPGEVLLVTVDAERDVLVTRTAGADQQR